MIINATIKNALLVGVLLVFYQMTSFAQSITTTFSYTGAMQTWTVPAGVTSVNIEVFGAQGNAGIGPNGGGAGAMGGKASGDLAVVPGQILNIFVGGSASGQTGGYNGGGNGGGLVGPNQNNGTGVGGGGGGASDVRTGGTALSDRIIVGGGGGGGGVAGCEAAYSGGVGGNGGGGNGASGTSSPNGGGGSGGTLGAGGIEGIGCSGFLGTSGSLPNGGHGQACCCFAAGKSTIPAGGGGGGGFVQGGGGGGGSAGTVGCSGNDKGGGGGGGGGSSYVGGVTAGLTSTGVQSGNGKILITYTIPLPTIVCPPSINVITDEGLCGARICYSSPVASSSVAPVTPAGFFFVASYNNSYYYQSTSYFNYADAQAAAVAAGGHLAVITSAAENNAINAGGGGFAWLGGNDLDSDGIWKWSNCETNSYSNFCAGEPNGSTFENYLEFETGGCWNDLLSNAPRAALVEIEGAILSQTSGYPQNALFPVGTTTNTFVATNSAGATTCSMTITVTDTESPKAICKNISRNLNPTSGMRSIVASDVDNGSSDNCTVQSIAIDKSSFNCTNVGANTVILTVTDNSANTQTCAATVTISYASAPVAKCRNAIIALSSAGNGTITGAGINNNSTDLCLSSGLTLSLSKSAYNCSNLGPNTVTLTVTNVAGNSSTCTGTVTVKDLVKPVAKCKAAAATVPPGGTVTILAGDVNNGSTDACTSPPLITLTPNTFTCANSGANTVILTVKDGSNNVSTCSAMVTITCGGAAPQQSIGTPAFADYTELMDLFPNPAADKVNIRLSKAVSTATPVTILDNTGRTLYSGWIAEGSSQLQVDLNQSQFTSGIYLVSVKLKDRVQTKSLVIFRE